jgi:hypothetical protein
MTALSYKDAQQLREDISVEIERRALMAAKKGVLGQEVADEISQIESLQKILSALPIKPVNSLRWLLTTGAICLVAVSIVAIIPVRKARIQIDVSSASVTLRPAQDFDWHGIWRVDPGIIQLKDFVRLRTPPDYGRSTSSSPTSLNLRISDGRAWISGLNLDRGVALTISQNKFATNLVARDGGFRGHVDVIGSIGAGDSEDDGVGSLPARRFNMDEPPGVFEFDYSSAGGSPTARRALLRITPTEQVTLREIPVSGLGFFEERPDGLGGPHFESQVIEGTIIMTDTGERVALNPASMLQLDDAQGLVTALQVTPNATRVKFEGSVRSVKVGSGEFIRNLKPTYLEWLYHQQTLVLLWGALAFLFGTAVSARKFLTG